MRTESPGNPFETITVPEINIAAETARHVFVARGSETEWNGHPSTVLLPDGRTIFCAWQGRRDGSRKHGAPAGFMKRSDDGGRTWSDCLELPGNWLETGRGAPTIHRLVDPAGRARLLVFCRDEHRTTFLQGVSADDGRTWSPLRPLPVAAPGAGPVCGWTAPLTILEARAPDGSIRHLMWYERSREGKPAPGVIWQSASGDGGLSWGGAKPVLDCAGASEPAAVRSPDGRQLLLLARENNRETNSLWAVSDDEGETWSAPGRLPLALTGDRHLPRYAPDGRLVIAFRPVAPGHRLTLSALPASFFTAWVGRYGDITAGREGQYLVRLMRSHRGADHTYPGLEVLPGGNFVATTYIQYRPDPELHSIVSTRFHLAELDARLAKE